MLSKKAIHLTIPYSLSQALLLLLLLGLALACQQAKPTQEVAADQDPLGAIEAMVDETQAQNKAEAEKVDEATHRALGSLRDLVFEPGTASERLYQAIAQGKDLKQEVFIFKTLEFKVDQAKVLPAMDAELSQIARIMEAFPNLKFEIGVHTEGVGDPESNLQLAQQRAQALAAALEKLGLNKSRMKAKGYGDTFPLADPTRPEGREANRRVELSFE